MALAMLTPKGICIIIMAIILSLANWAYKPILKYNKIGQKHPYHIVDDIMPTEDLSYFESLSKQMTFSSTLKADMTYKGNYGTQEIKDDGTCPNRLTSPNQDKTQCLFAARSDVGKHYFLSGGYGAKKELYETSEARLTFFQHFIHFKSNDSDSTGIPAIDNLFNSQRYKTLTKDICLDKPILEPIQVSILVNLPGQEVAIHYDSPFFIGASRFYYPLWLLVVMQQSSLFQDMEIPQVQGVTYLHNWTDVNTNGGGFYFYPNGKDTDIKVARALKNRGVILDGTKCPHGTQTFKNKSFVPNTRKNLDQQLQYSEELKEWVLYNEDKSINRTYVDNDVRISLVWRQRCFESVEQQEEFRKSNEFQTEQEVNEVIKILMEHLISNNKITEWPRDQIKVAEILIENYISYPYDRKTIMPYNICFLAEYLDSWKIMTPLLKLVC